MAGMRFNDKANLLPSFLADAVTGATHTGLPASAGAPPPGPACTDPWVTASGRPARSLPVVLAEMATEMQQLKKQVRC